MGARVSEDIFLGLAQAFFNILKKYQPKKTRLFEKKKTQAKFCSNTQNFGRIYMISRPKNLKFLKKTQCFGSLDYTIFPG